MRATKRLDRRRVYVLPTRHGLLLAAMLVVILLGAINYDNALAYLLAFLLGSLFVTTILHTYRNLAGLELRSGHAEPVFAGVDAEFQLTLDPAAGHVHRALRCMRLAPVPPPRWWRRDRADGAASVATLSAETASLRLPVPAARRGRLVLGRVRLESCFPLGVLRAWGYFAAGDIHCLVFPAPAGALPLPVQPLAAAGGERGTGAGAEDFAGLREYRHGESLRGIHWRAAARTEQLLVKRFAGGEVADVWLRWQDLAGVDGEARLSQLAQWVLDAERSHLRYGLELPGRRLEAGLGLAHRERALGMLALFELP